MVRILHFSDLHLDVSFAADATPSLVGARRRADLRATLGRILAQARELQVDAVTIAGDLYDQDHALPDTGEFLSQQFARMVPARVFIAPGKNDPYTNQSLYGLTRWSDNVSIFNQGQMTAFDLAPGVHLWGAACPPARGYQTLENVTLDQHDINLLLLYAMVEPRHGDGGLFSVDTAKLRRSGFDFALLGGEHLGRLWPEDDPIAVYPGSPDPLRREEANGAHHVVLLTIDNGQIMPELIPISEWRYHDLTIDLTGCTTAEAAAKRVAHALQALPAGVNERTICHIVLTGEPGFDMDTTALQELLETKSHVRFDVRLSMPYNIEALALEQTVRGALVRRFQDLLAAAGSDQERRLALNALHLALEALDGKQVHSHEVA